MTAADSIRRPDPARATAPVFVVGSPRSGTTLLYHMLLSAGGFAIYRAETHVFNTLAPRFGNLERIANRTAMADAFIRSDMFRVAELDEPAFRADVQARCRSAGDFLRIFMEAICRKQGAPRWAETTPVHVLHIPEIKATIPDALFIHVIRDGRDVAVSMAKQQWVRPLPGQTAAPELAAGAWWDWIVSRGRQAGRVHREAYIEVNYESLVAEPAATLARVADFIAQPLDHETILRNAIGSVRRPNTSFPGKTASFTGRWRDELDAPRAEMLEAMLAPTLRRLGYPVDRDSSSAVARRARGVKRLYFTSFALRNLLKTLPGTRRLISLDLFEPGAVNPGSDEKREPPAA